jgi:hypothetical protein
LKGVRKAPPALDHRHCRFGTWLVTERLGARGKSAEMNAIDTVHQQAHDFAAELVALQTAYQTEDALNRLPELYALRDKLLSNLLHVKPRASHRLLRSSKPHDD